MLITHSSRSLRSPARLDEEAYIETHFSAQAILHHACWIIEQAGEDPARVIVEESTG
ncbi:hypothetical protein [Thermoflexus sp.]|uniref:hypothetical protein n=1 Tax=Thermoflexus sp. TaxID=1969742 RepID=UPI0035E40A65